MKMRWQIPKWRSLLFYRFFCFYNLVSYVVLIFVTDFFIFYLGNENRTKIAEIHHCNAFLRYKNKNKPFLY